MIVKVALLMPFLLALVALGVDVGLFYMQLGDLQVAANAAAAGAALDLPSDFTATASRLVESNMPSAIHGTVLAGSDLEVGRWDGRTRTFTANATPANAVRVTTRKSISSGRPAQWLVGSFFGLSALDLSASATAIRLPEIPGALSSRSSIDMKGVVSTDSYDASAGTYNPSAPGGDGDVIAEGAITLGGSAYVNGDAKSASVSLSGNATVTGTTSPLRRPLDLPSVDATAASVTNNNAGLPLVKKGKNLISPLDAQRNFSLTGGVNYQIPPGTYYFNNFSLGGQSTLSVSGPTIIYLTGNFDSSGGDVINSTQIPNNLRIFMTGGTAKVNAGVDWYGLLYAPDTEVSINGNADIFGAVVGRVLETSGTADIHFDLSLTLGDQVVGLSKRSTIVD
jgi:hypothetical protein